MTNGHSAPSRRALADDPATPPDTLAKLLADGNLHVRRAAARNPSAPAQALELLRRAGSSADLSATARADPTLDSRALDDAAALGEWGRRLAARHPNASARLLSRLAVDPAACVRCDVAGHSGATTDLLRDLVADADVSVRRAAQTHPRAPGDWIAVLQTAERGDALDPAALCELAQGGSWARRLAAQHPATPGELLSTLAADVDWRVRAALAFNPFTPAELLEALDVIDDVPVRLALAGHSRASHNLLRRILGDDVRIRLALAQRGDLPHDILLMLALDGRAEVRTALAKGHRLPAEMVEALRRLGVAADLTTLVQPDATMQAREVERFAAAGRFGAQLAARHPATPRRLLVELATHADPLLRELTARHPNLPVELLPLLRQAGSREDLQGFSEPDATLHPEQLHVLARLGPWARRLAARHPGSSAVLLVTLARDADPQVRREAARHPATPAAVLAELAGDPSVEVRWAVGRRDDAPAEAMMRLACDEQATLRAAAAEHPATPGAALARLCGDPDRSVRAAGVNRVISQPSQREQAGEVG